MSIYSEFLKRLRPRSHSRSHTGYTFRRRHEKLPPATWREQTQRETVQTVHMHCHWNRYVQPSFENCSILVYIYFRNNSNAVHIL